MCFALTVFGLPSSSSLPPPGRSSFASPLPPPPPNRRRRRGPRAHRMNIEIRTKIKWKLRGNVATSAGCMTNWQGGAEPCRALIGPPSPPLDTPSARTHNTHRAQIRKCAPNVGFFEERLGAWTYLEKDVYTCVRGRELITIRARLVAGVGGAHSWTPRERSTRRERKIRMIIECLTWRGLN